MQTSILFQEDKSKILDGLNDAQLSAVKHTTGPLLIIAGAGTGKTTVITRRIAYLIEQKLAKPSEILALTFTEKAASEMEERVDMLVPYGFTDMWISTFNAFGDRLLRDYALDLGLPANFKVLTATEQAIFMRQNIYAFELDYFRPIASPISHIDALLKHFSRLKDELIDPETYLKYANTLASRKNQTDEELVESKRAIELAGAYQKYQDLMIQNGNLDFGDQIYLTYQLLSKNKRVLRECLDRFKFVLVDEFQDTNFAQNEIVKLLSGTEKNITVVGDDDQSIYRFRGASISNIMEFMKTFPDANQIVLNNNYRSTQEILDAAYTLIQHNNPDRLEVKNSIDKRLISPKKGTDPELIFSQNLSGEADAVVEKINELKKSKKYANKDFSILVRANSHSEPFIQALNMAGIPYAFSGASGLFSQPEVKMLTAFLKCLAYTDDTLAFYQLATGELYSISHEALTDYYTIAKRNNRSLIEITDVEIQNLLDNNTDTIGKNDIAQINKLIKDVKKYSEHKNDSCGEVLYAYLKETNYLKRLVEDPTAENQFKINNIAKFFERIAQFNHTSNERGVLAFLNNLEMILEVGDEAVSSDIDPDLDAVNILTAHASKGLEWPVVFVVNCVSDRFPGRNKHDPLPIPNELIKERLPEGDYHVQEERRLFYVACTRAKEYLFLTAAEDYGGKRSKKLSQFVLEALNESTLSQLKHKLSPMEKIERFQKLEFKPPKIPAKFQSEVLRLSRAQIDDYYTCPKKFYFAHIIKIPLLENQYLMYGTAIHAALDHYFGRKIIGEIPTLEQLITDYKTAFKNVGFITREQEDLRYKQGLETLTNFFAADQKNPTIPSAVEIPFEFAENKIKINGRYDLVCGEGENAEIKDFKTSAVKEEKDAKDRIKKSTQMMIYALAWYEKFGVIPKTTLVFIESGLEGSSVFKEKDLEKTKDMIFQVAEGIRKQDMTAKPDARNCQLCPYHDICPESKA
jgi:DNA helicase-2/ATP-dependent DNA helicase PcrA